MAKKLGGISADLGMLILRVGIGIIFILHGWPKVIGGPERWEALGDNMAMFGIAFMPVFWGFMAAISEFLGGIAIALGVLTKSFSLLLLVTMIVATGFHISAEDPFARIAHPMALGVVFLSLFFMGPGRFSFTFLIRKKRQKSKSDRKE